MPTKREEIVAAIDEAAAPGFRGRLLARGQARAMIWRNGVLPENSPAFSPQLSYDLLGFGYSILGLGLRLRELGDDEARARLAFEQAATALEATITRSNPADADRSFHFIMAAASYHLARYSARAYSLLSIISNEDNFSIIEKSLAKLMLRDFTALEAAVIAFKTSGIASDERISETLSDMMDDEEQQPEGRDEGEASTSMFDAVDLALTDGFLGALAVFLLAIERGERSLLDDALDRLRQGLDVCIELSLVPQWWTHRLAIHLLADLWESSFHERLPLAPAGGEAEDWASLREIFLGSLNRRDKAEIELWPSQIGAAVRAADHSDDLVVSLPTSAGKTRIAELCILRCLAGGRRVVFVTPLRALSSQTEATLRRTFSPLGKTISALYGSVGMSGFDEDAIRERHIVVATPEKLDFALRNDPTLLDDVGLLVFDEGHMIGPNEREIRYEVQIQRLLKRDDAEQRRIVCLSAILPDGNQLDDFANWLCRDEPGEGVVKSDWRPTRLRFGEVMWNGTSARLNLRVGDERPFVPRFFDGAVPPIGQRKKVFPKDIGELCLATAWRLVDDDQSVLIYCPVRAHVEPFADRIVDLNNRGSLRSLLVVDEDQLSTAITLGQEWLGVDHPIIKCLRLGVAIHHGALPTAFRKEIERLLREGVLRVTISSPTLAQGLNLSATSVIIHSLFRNKKRIETSEFKNVIGRAGRAYIDVEGLILYPVIDKAAKRVAQWEALIDDLKAREMESGLVRLVVALLVRMNKSVGGDFQQLAEYVANNANAWIFPDIPEEKAEDRKQAFDEWQQHIATLDTAILSLIGENDIPDEGIVDALDSILQSSLWQRSLDRRNRDQQLGIKAALAARSTYIWQNSTGVSRRGYFLAGLGLESGHALDAIAAECNLLLVQANGALMAGQAGDVIAAITAIAERVFLFHPFKPEVLPDNWRAILRCWLLGEPLAAVADGQQSKTLQFVEGGLVYRLPWAMASIRVRGIANGDMIDDFQLEDFELGLAIPAVETGTISRSAAVLIQAGFNSRIAAIKVVNETGAEFSTGQELQTWLTADDVQVLSLLAHWPTPETHEMWVNFARTFAPSESMVWLKRSWRARIDWRPGEHLPSGDPVRLFHLDDEPIVLSPDGMPLGKLRARLNPDRQGLLRAKVHTEENMVALSYIGPDDLWLK